MLLSSTDNQVLAQAMKKNISWQCWKSKLIT
jgi:hypothetical protein